PVLLVAARSDRRRRRTAGPGMRSARGHPCSIATPHTTPNARRSTTNDPVHSAPMSRFTFLSAGESHGPQLTVIVTGMPAGVALDRERINHDLARRQHGYGRGGRMKIER